MRPKLTENSESQPNKPKTINLLERGSYKWTTKPRKIKLEMDWVQIDRIRHTNSTKYLPRTNSRTKCSYIDHFFCLQSVFLSPLFFSIFHTLFLWRKFPYIVPPIHPNLLHVQFLGNPLDACPIKAFLEIIGRAVS